MRNQTGGLNVFTVGGTVQAGPGVYIPRRADDELLSLCRDGAFAYVLTARQMGKSSLMVRTAERLLAEGVRSVTIDLTKIGAGQEVTAEKWYLGLLVVITKRLGLKVNVIKWWQERAHLTMAQRLTDFFEEALLVEVPERVVIFIDEIDTTLRLSFTDDFYAAIRYLYNERSRIPAFRRLSFVLIGVATPSDLIHNPDQTPFNIGQRVDLTDFTFDESELLAAGFHLPPEATRRVLGWVRDWTCGHPYLTQRLCRAIADQGRAEWTEDDVRQVVASTFLGERSEQDNNLQFVADMLTVRAGELENADPAEVLLTYGEVRGGRPVRDEEQSLVKSHLKLSGVVCRDKGLLRVRNRIYSEVFDDKWVKAHLPPTWVKRQLKRTRGIAAALAAGLLVVTTLTVFASNRALEARKQSQEASKQRQLAETRLVEAENQRRIAEEHSREARRQQERAEQALSEVEEQKKQIELQRLKALDAQKDAELAASKELQARKEAERVTAEAVHQKNLADLHAQMDRHYRDGVDLFFKGEQVEAIGSFNKALEIYKRPEIGDLRGQAVTLSNIAAAYERMASHKEAAEKYREANEAYARLKDPAGQAFTRLNLGKNRLRLKEFDSAREDFTQAKKIYSENKDLPGEAAALDGLASTYYVYDPSVELGLLSDDMPPPDEGQSEPADKEKNMTEAIRHLRQVADLHMRDNSAAQAAEVFTKIGRIYRQLGKRKEAVDYHMRAGEIYRKDDNSPSEALVHRQIIALFEGTGDKQELIAYLKKQIDDNRDAGNKYYESRSLNQLAEVYKSIGDMTAALAYYEQAVDSHLQAGSKSDNTDYDDALPSYLEITAIADEYVKIKDDKRAIAFFEKLARLHGSGSYSKGMALAELAKAQRRAGKREDAIKTLQDALVTAKGSSTYHNVSALEEIGEMYLEAGEKKKAAEAYEKAIEYAKRDPDTGILSISAQTLQDALGQIYRDLGEDDKSVNIYAQLMAEKNLGGETYIEAATRISDIHRKAGNITKADQVLNEALEKGLDGKNDETKLGMLMRVGSYYKKVADYPRALNFFDRALRLSKQGDTKEREVEVWLYEMMSDAYFMQGDRQKTVEAMQRTIASHKEHKNNYGALRMMMALAFVHQLWGEDQKVTAHMQEALAFYRSPDSHKELPLSFIMEAQKLQEAEKEQK